ncbi:MAG TPA: hypothetical protein VNN55_02445 [bacterium]|nr:hypothetical protein [bacterium]
MALNAFFKCESDLLVRESSERSITHKLAEHLQAYFPEFKVDCEYNRHGSEVKRLRNHGEPTTSNDLGVRSVYPDIVVHERGRDSKNVLVIETKKSSSRQPHEWDCNKLKEFTGTLFRYEIGLLLVLDLRRMRLSKVQCFKNGKKVAAGIWTRLKELRYGV